MNKKPALTYKHLKKYMQGETMLKWIKDNMDWENVIFPDEKYLNLDGLDCFKCYYQDVRKVKFIRWNRSFKGGSLLLYVFLMSANGKTDSVVVLDAMNTDISKNFRYATFSIFFTFKDQKLYFLTRWSSLLHF